MVYIDKHGRVLKKRPWDLNRILQIFYALWGLLLHFFTTLFGPFRTENRGNSSRGNSSRAGWGSVGGGGGGGGGGGSGGGGAGNVRPGSNRRIGRITNSMDCNIPGGGCSGGGCGL